MPTEATTETNLDYLLAAVQVRLMAISAAHGYDSPEYRRVEAMETELIRRINNASD